MKRSIYAIALLLAGLVFGQTTPVLTSEVLVTTGTAVQLTRDSRSPGVEIYNHGPNAIWCAFVTQSFAVSGKARKIAPEGTWAIVPLAPTVAIWCVADTASQVTGAATVVSQFR